MMEMEKEWRDYNPRGLFICENCRNICKGTCHEEMLECFKEGKMPKDDPYFFPRKQIITCLGPFCKSPCKYQQKETDLTIEQAMNIIKFFAWRLDKELKGKKERYGHE